MTALWDVMISDARERMLDKLADAGLRFDGELRVDTKRDPEINGVVLAYVALVVETPGREYMSVHMQCRYHERREAGLLVGYDLCEGPML